MLNLIGEQLLEEDYSGAVMNCERLLSFLPTHSPMWVDVLAHLGTAHAMLQNYPQSYAILTQALELSPDAADLWYSRGMACHFTMRFTQFLKDFERAVALNKDPALSERFAKELQESRKLAEESARLRGPDFTQEQLLEQENLYQRGLATIEASQWQEAEEAFRQSIAMADVLPQPWSNLGLTLMMPKRYDEAEAAFKRALVIEPHYTLAKNNLMLFDEARRTGPPKQIGMKDPFSDVKVKQNLTYVVKD